LSSTKLLIKSPRSVGIDITNRCNLRCSYCYHFDSPGDVQDLPKEEWLQFFEELNRSAVLEIVIAGGEPFFRPDLKEIIEGIVKNRMRFGILSNGTLIDDDMAAFLAQTKRCNYVQVSIDGANPHSHDVFRGKGSLDKALHGIETLQKHKNSVAVRVTLHKNNIHELDQIARLLLDDLHLPSFSTNAAGYMGLCQVNSTKVGLETQDRIFAMQKLVELNKIYDNRITANAGPLADAEYWHKMIEAKKQRQDRLPLGGFLNACGCVFDKMDVRADGVIVPCCMLSHIELGRINQDDFLQIWRNHPEMLKVRERRNIPLTDFEFCHGCGYINYCTGNCPALAYTLTGQVNHPSPDACLRLFLNDGGTLPVLDDSSTTL
jgi:SynChlorMet cassette radical SAM/SPASM protein ScmE